MPTQLVYRAFSTVTLMTQSTKILYHIRLSQHEGATNIVKLFAVSMSVEAYKLYKYIKHHRSTNSPGKYSKEKALIRDRTFPYTVPNPLTIRKRVFIFFYYIPRSKLISSIKLHRSIFVRILTEPQSFEIIFFPKIESPPVKMSNSNISCERLFKISSDILGRS